VTHKLTAIVLGRLKNWGKREGKTFSGTKIWSETLGVNQREEKPIDARNLMGGNIYKGCKENKEEDRVN